MAVLTYRFGMIVYMLEDEPANGATLTITWGSSNPRHILWARFVFKRDGSSTVTTAEVPRLFQGWVIQAAQRQFAELIRHGKGISAFKILQAHFDARKLTQAIRNSIHIPAK